MAAAIRAVDRVTRFVLASASPARLATLRAAGVTPEVMVSDVDESQVTAPATAELVALLARAKALHVARTLDGAALVLGCDSLLEFEGESLGKPRSSVDAVARWRRLRGRDGVLWTGHHLVDVARGRHVERAVPAVVHFAAVSDAEIVDYVATGEPLQVAGAFTVDGLGGWFVERIEGDYHNVVGLSLPTLRGMLGELGYGLRDLGYPPPISAPVE